MQGGTGLLSSQGLPLLSASKTLIMAGHVLVQWHQCTVGDWKNAGASPGRSMAVSGQEPVPPGPKWGCFTLPACCHMEVHGNDE